MLPVVHDGLDGVEHGVVVEGVHDVDQVLLGRSGARRVVGEVPEDPLPFVDRLVFDGVS